MNTHIPPTASQQLGLFGTLENTLSSVDTQAGWIAHVLVDLPHHAGQDAIYTYRVPDHWPHADSLDHAPVALGAAVLVTVGKRECLGIITRVHHSSVEPDSVLGGLLAKHTTLAFSQLKPLLDVMHDTPLVNGAFLHFAQWIAQYYATSLMTVIQAAVPSALFSPPKRRVRLTDKGARLIETLLHNPAALSGLPLQALLLMADTPKREHWSVHTLAQQLDVTLLQLNPALHTLAKEGWVILFSELSHQVKPQVERWLTPHALNDVKLTSRQQTVLDWCLANGPSEYHQTLEALGTTPKMIQALIQQGVLSLSERLKNPHRQLGPSHPDHALVTLSDAQSDAVQRISNSPAGSLFTLFGVTGSGKTEVYLSLAQQALAQGQSVLVLVPEIALTQSIANRFIERLGVDNVVLWHSQFADGDKVTDWWRLRQGEARLVIGARSSMLTPIDNLGLIIIDEAHEGSYKQDNPNPRYDARRCAVFRAQQTGAKVVMGSATPDVEWYYRSKEAGQVIHLPQRFGGRSMARVSVVDLANSDMMHGGVISVPLLHALTETWQRGEQSIIFLNRRGFFTAMQCQVCKTVLECPHCSVMLTYHKANNTVSCHYCGYRTPKPQFCQHCASSYWENTGIGTQRLEAELATHLPGIRLLRLDGDVMQKKQAHHGVMQAMNQHDADVLIGTQIVAKGLDMHNVTLVGVVGADLTFSMPDYKSTERGFQLLTQVAGRAGRGEKPGHVIFQTYQPNHPVIQLAQSQDYPSFFELELTHRALLGFPPYAQLFRFIISSPDEQQAEQFSQSLAINLTHDIETAGLSQQIELVGPANCLIHKVQNRFRSHLMLKNQAGEAGHQLITSLYSKLKPPKDINCLLDVDAQQLL